MGSLLSFSLFSHLLSQVIFSLYLCLLCPGRALLAIHWQYLWLLPYIISCQFVSWRFYFSSVLLSPCGIYVSHLLFHVCFYLCIWANGVFFSSWFFHIRNFYFGGGMLSFSLVKYEAVSFSKLISGFYNKSFSKVVFFTLNFLTLLSTHGRLFCTLTQLPMNEERFTQTLFVNTVCSYFKWPTVWITGIASMPFFPPSKSQPLQIFGTEIYNLSNSHCTVLWICEWMEYVKYLSLQHALP